MSQSSISAKGLLNRRAETDINASIETVFNYISSGELLPDWLKKCGPVNGVVKTEIVKGPYNFPGASRTVYFDNGDTLTEQLLSFDPVGYYSYSVTKITDPLRHLTSIGYGQWWFENQPGGTHVKWVYSFLPKNLFARLALSIFLSLFYTKFMNQALRLAKARIEK